MGLVGTGSLGVDLPHSVGGHPISCRRSRFNLILFGSCCFHDVSVGEGGSSEVGEVRRERYGADFLHLI